MKLYTGLLGFSLGIVAISGCAQDDDGHQASEADITRFAATQRSVFLQAPPTLRSHTAPARATSTVAQTLRAGHGLSAFDGFEVASDASRGDHRFVRMRQTHRGIPVWGASIIARYQADRLKDMRGTITAGLGDIDPDPSVSAHAAEHIAEQATRADRLVTQGTELVVYAHKTESRLAWHVEVVAYSAQGIARWHYFIDAHNGEIIAQKDLLTTEQASGPGGTPKFTHEWNAELDVEVDTATGDFVMDTPRTATFDLQESFEIDNPGPAVTGSSLDNFGNASANDAHGYAEITLDMLGQWMERNSIDDNGYQILSLANVGTDYNNAFWDGTHVGYSAVGSITYALSGDLDVVSHEIAHGFTEFHSRLIYEGESGGLNESFSDVAGIAAEWFWGNPTWFIGENVLREVDVLRYICTPTLDERSVDHYDDFTQSLGVHFSSGISNVAFCRSAKRMASGSPDGEATADTVRKVARAWFEANANYWTESTTFALGCQGVVDAAKALNYTEDEVDAIRQSWADAGVYCDGAVAPPPACDETYTDGAGVITSPNYPNAYPNEYRRTICIAPASGEPVTLTFTNFNTEAGYDFVSLIDGATASTTFSLSSGSAAPAPVTAAKIAIRFTSDQSVTESGWRAEWTTPNGNVAPIADFEAAVADLSASFTDLSSDEDGSIATWRWDFGDGDTATTQNPSHDYAEAGTYTVSLVVVDGGGATHTATKDIDVGDTSSGGCASGGPPTGATWLLLGFVCWFILRKRPTRATR